MRKRADANRRRRGSFAGKDVMRDNWPQDKLVAVALLSAAVPPDSKAAVLGSSATIFSRSHRYA